MGTAGLACLMGLLTVVAGDRLPGAFHRLAARQVYGYSYPFPPLPTPTSTSSSSVGVSASVLSATPGTISAAGTRSVVYGTPSLSVSALSTGVHSTGNNSGSFTNVTVIYRPSSTGASGTAPGTISPAGTTGAPFGNSTISHVGTAYSTGSLIYTYGTPNATSATASGKPLPSSNATTAGSISGDPTPSTNATSSGTIEATPASSANTTGSGYSRHPYPTHGPYPVPWSKKSFAPSGTVGTGVSSRSTISANATSAAPTDPSTSRVYPPHGPYPFSSSIKPYSYSASSVIGTIGTSASYNPSASQSVSTNATTVPLLSATATPYSFSLSASPSTSVNATTISSIGTAPAYSFSLSGSPSISANGTSTLPSGSATIATGVTSSSDPSAHGTSSISYSITGTGTGISTGYPSSITAGSTSLNTSTKFSYTPTVTSQASEYYYHHRRPHHKEHHSAPSYEGDGYDYELDDTTDKFAFE